MPLVKLLVFLMSKSGEALQFILPAEYRDIADKAFKEAMQGNAQYYEIPAYHASGEMIWLDLTNLPIKQNHQVTGVFGIARDITLRRKIRNTCGY